MLVGVVHWDTANSQKVSLQKSIFKQFMKVSSRESGPLYGSLLKILLTEQIIYIENTYIQIMKKSQVHIRTCTYVQHIQVYGIYMCSDSGHFLKFLPIFPKIFSATCI